MALFGKKQGPQDKGDEIPIQLVLNLRNQGFNDDQIIQNLQQQGYKPQQIFDAMSQADISPNNSPQSQLGQEGQEQFQAPQTPLPPTVSETEVQPMQAPAQTDIERIEEIAEAIIEEKWDELSKNIQKVVEWKSSVEAKINKIEEDVKTLRENFDSINKALLERLNQYDKNLLNVGIEVKAMEKVFKKILPAFTESINELSRLTKTLKSVKQSRKKKNKRK